MAKKTSTGRVVDIAALSRIGRARTAPSQPENRNMDKFLQFAGTIAIDLFSKAFNKRLEMNEKNSIKIDDFKVDNKDAYNTIPALDKAITDYQNMYNDGTKKKVGIFNIPVSEKAKGRSQEGRDLISQADIGLSSLEEETSIYQNSKQKAHDIQHKGFITDPDGRQINASYSGLNLPEDIIFQQAYADGILDDYIQIQDGKFYLPQGIIENIDLIASQKIDDQPHIADLVPMEKWPKATLSQSEKYDNISVQLQGDAIKMGFARDYDENTDGSTYATLLKKTTNEMSPNELMSSLFDSTLEFNKDGSIASSGRTIIDNFIDNPTFEVEIDHDADPSTPKAVFDGTQKYIEREFGKNKTEETLTKNEAEKLAVWKQGVTNELKTALNPNSPDIKDYLIQNGVEQTKFKQQQEWKVSPNNPDSPNYINKNKSGPGFTSTFDERTSTSNMNAILALSKKEKINFDDDIKFNFMPASDDLELRFDETTNEVILSQKKLYKDQTSVITLGKANITDRNKLKGLLYEYTGTLTQDRR